MILSSPARAYARLSVLGVKTIILIKSLGVQRSQSIHLLSLLLPQLPLSHGSVKVSTVFLVFSVTPFKIDQNKSQNYSTDKVQNLGNEGR